MYHAFVDISCKAASSMPIPSIVCQGEEHPSILTFGFVSHEGFARSIYDDGGASKVPVSCATVYVDPEAPFVFRSLPYGNCGLSTCREVHDFGAVFVGDSHSEGNAAEQFGWK